MHHHHHETDSAAPEGGEMPFVDKIDKLLSHWIKHNHDHAATYRDWAARAREHRLSEVGAMLEEVAEMTDQITAKFESAVHRLPKEPP
jgi:hypothetical protein